MSSLPYQIIVAPFEVYLSVVGENFPAIDTADPTSGTNWELLGTNGNLDYSDDGVTVTHEQTIQMHHFLGTTGPRKASRTEEQLLVEFTLHDLTLEEYAKILNDATVTTTAASSGTAGDKAINLLQGFSVSTWAMVIKGDGPYGADWKMQYEVPMVIRDGSPAVTFNKAEPAGLAFTFRALEDPNNPTAASRFGVLRAQHADALA